MELVLIVEDVVRPAGSGRVDAVERFILSGNAGIFRRTARGIWFLQIIFYVTGKGNYIFDNHIIATTEVSKVQAVTTDSCFSAQVGIC